MTKREARLLIRVLAAKGIPFKAELNPFGYIIDYPAIDKQEIVRALGAGAETGPYQPIFTTRVPY